MLSRCVGFDRHEFGLGYCAAFLTGLSCRAGPIAYRCGMQDKDALATLNWLVEAGADEAIGEQPVNRLVAKAVPPASSRAPPAASPAPRRAARACRLRGSGDAIGDAPWPRRRRPPAWRN